MFRERFSRALRYLSMVSSLVSSYTLCMMDDPTLKEGISILSLCTISVSLYLVSIQLFLLYLYLKYEYTLGI